VRGSYRTRGTAAMWLSSFSSMDMMLWRCEMNRRCCAPGATIGAEVCSSRGPHCVDDASRPELVGCRCSQLWSLARARLVYGRRVCLCLGALFLAGYRLFSVRL